MSSILLAVIAGILLTQLVYWANKHEGQNAGPAAMIIAFVVGAVIYGIALGISTGLHLS